MDIHYVKFFGPLLDLFKAEQVTRERSCQIVFVHTYVVNILDVLRIARVHLPVAHGPDFLNEALLVESIKRDVKVTELENDTAETPDIGPAVIPITP